MVSFGGVAVGEIGYAADVPAGGSTRIYLLDSANGLLYKSADDGGTWSDISPSSFGILAFDALGGSGGNDVLVVTDNAGLGQARKSADGGSTWTTLTDWFPDGTDAQDVSIISSTRYLITGGSAFSYSRHTTDGGATWGDLETPPPFSDQQKVVNGGTKRWYHLDGSTTDLGRSSLDLSGEETFSHAPDGYTGLCVVSDSLAFVTSMDFGGPAEKLDAINVSTLSNVWPSGAMDAGCAFCCWSTQDKAIWVANLWDRNLASTTKPNLGQLWKSTNQGSSWTKVAEHHGLQPLAVSAQGKGIAVDPGDPLKWWAIGGTGYDAGDAPLWKSTDGGDTWASSVPVSGSHALGAVIAVSG